jgi:hypothetical protein
MAARGAAIYASVNGPSQAASLDPRDEREDDEVQRSQPFVMAARVAAIGALVSGCG